MTDSNQNNEGEDRAPYDHLLADLTEAMPPIDSLGSAVSQRGRHQINGKYCGNDATSAGLSRRVVRTLDSTALAH